MLDLLNNPAVQAAVAPGMAAIIAAALLYKVRPTLSTLALLVGFLTTSALITDLSLQPITSTKKIILLTIFAAIFGLVLLIFSKKKIIVLSLISFSGIVACSWLLWPVLARMGAWEAIVMLAPLAAFCVYVVVISTSNRISNQDRLISGVIYASVTSISCVLGASALLGQLSASLAAGTGAVLFIGFLAGLRQKSDILFSVMLFFPVSLIAVAANIYATLPWYILPLLASIPTMYIIPVSENMSQWKRTGLFFGLAMLPSSVAILLILNTADTMGGY